MSAAIERSGRRLRHALLSAGVVLGLGLAVSVQAQEPGPADEGVADEVSVASLEGDPFGAAATTSGGPGEFNENLSVWGMFMAAGTLVKSVMTLLLLASVYNVTVFFEKAFVMRRVNKQSDRFLQAFRSARSLEELGQAKVTGPMARMFSAGMQELTLSASGKPINEEQRERISERVGYTMGIVQSHETRKLGSSMSLLATIGSTAPFIGLFGTVWGIMTSFIGIAQAQTTNLAVVAPGIAEALLATAIGLAAAIPAVMLYNKFSRDIGQFTGRLQDFSSEFAVVMSRELDRREVA